MIKNLQIRAGDGSPLVAITVTGLRSEAEPVVDDVDDWLAEAFWIHDEDPGSERVAVDRDVLEELVDVGNGQLESMVPNGPYDEDDDVVQELVSVIEQAEDALETAKVIDA